MTIARERLARLLYETETPATPVDWDKAIPPVQGMYLTQAEELIAAGWHDGPALPAPESPEWDAWVAATYADQTWTFHSNPHLMVNSILLAALRALHPAKEKKDD